MPLLSKAIYLTGGYTICEPLYRFMISAHSHQTISNDQMHTQLQKLTTNEHGETPWALVTGASAGIGREFAM